MANKKGVSIIIGYVLLIVIAISLSIMVYTWLKSQLPKPENECPEDASLAIKDYGCSPENKNITITLENKGLFSIDGFKIKIANETEGLAVYSLKKKIGEELTEDINIRLKPNEETEQEFSYREHNRIVKIEVQPYIFDGKRILCKNIASQKVEGCS